MIADREAVVVGLLQAAAAAVEVKSLLVKRAIRRRVNRYLHLKQAAETERELQRVVAELIRDQVGSIVGRLRSRGKEVLELIEKGDEPGHPFRGNQWTGGQGGGSSEGGSVLTEPDPGLLSRIPVYVDKFGEDPGLNSHAAFRRETWEAGRDSIVRWASGEKPAVISEHGEYAVVFLQNGRQLFFRRGDPLPAPAGQWQGFWDPDLKEVLGITAGKYRGMSRTEKMQADCDVQARKYASLEFEMLRDQFWKQGDRQKSCTTNKELFEKQGSGQVAGKLIRRLFDPADWREELTNRCLPVLAVGMAKAMVSELLTLGIDIRRPNKRKATTATEWLEENPEDLDRLIDMVAGANVPGFAVFTEIPERMQQGIAASLQRSFEEPYWDGISETTGGDAERILARGLEEGRSIRDMAADLQESLGGDRYARVRAFNIARTESGNALNGARTVLMDDLKRELPEEVSAKMRRVWLSVLGSTTRAEHAELDGVPEDEDGLWELDGVKVPWPGHVSLSAAQRCNCQCTVVTEFGLDDSTAREEIEEYFERLEQEEASVRGLREKGDQPGYPFRGNQWSEGSGVPTSSAGRVHLENRSAGGV